MVDSNDERRGQVLRNTLSNHTMRGAVVVSQNLDAYSAVISYPPPPFNHVLHGVATLLTCLLWGIVWIVMYMQHPKERRIRITVLPDLEIREESIVLDR